MMREWNVRVAELSRCLRIIVSASSDEGDELDPIAGGEHRRRVLRAGHDLAVALDRDAAIAEAELDDQRGDGRTVYDGARSRR